MEFLFQSRSSDSPLVDNIWQTQSPAGGSFISTAASQWEMVITRQQGKSIMSIRGPQTRASRKPIPEDAEFLGIVFKHGVFMPPWPKRNLVNRELHLQESTKNTFNFHGSMWQFPDFENADTFIDRLVHRDMLAHDEIVDDVLRGHTLNLSLRSIQRRFMSVTGLTYKTIQQIRRARQALALLQSGVPVPQTAYQVGYFDQPHFTRSLKLFAGQTPAQILKSNQSKYVVLIQDETSL